MYILVINAGSSSIKYKLFDMADESVIAEGMADKIGVEGSSLKYRTISTAREVKLPINDYETGLDIIIRSLVDEIDGVVRSVDVIEAVGHRVVHGGTYISGSVLITQDVEEIIQRCFDLAPLHNPFNMMGIKACQKLLPKVPQVAVFDTAFHATLPKEAYLYAIPYELYEKHAIRRYGFHGTSHRYVAQCASEMMGIDLSRLKMVTCHLGNGCSITAIKEGKSFDTSMGFTPLEGLIMGTRSGDIDPAVIFYLVDQLGMTIKEVNSMLNKDSGLLGLSGLSRDMRELLDSAEKGNERAELAINCFAYRVKKYIGSYSAAMGGLDCIVFTAGIGENSPVVRKKICSGLEFLGVKIDERKNEANDHIISAPDSKVCVLVVPTNEELMIARDTAYIVMMNKVAS